MAYALTNDEAALARGIPQDTALWTGLCVALGTIWVSLAYNVISRQAIRTGIIVGLVSGMMLDGMGSPAWLAIAADALDFGVLAASKKGRCRQYRGHLKLIRHDNSAENGCFRFGRCLVQIHRSALQALHSLDGAPEKQVNFRNPNAYLSLNGRYFVGQLTLDELLLALQSELTEPVSQDVLRAAHDRILPGEYEGAGLGRRASTVTRSCNLCPIEYLFSSLATAQVLGFGAPGKL